MWSVVSLLYVVSFSHSPMNRISNSARIWLSTPMRVSRYSWMSWALLPWKPCVCWVWLDCWSWLVFCVDCDCVSPSDVCSDSPVEVALDSDVDADLDSLDEVA